MRAEDDITASQVPSSQAAAILDSDAASSQPEPKSTAGSDPPGQATSQQQEASQTTAAQQPQQPAEHAKPSTSSTDAAPAKQQAAVVGQQDAQQKQQASKPAEQQPAAAAAPKAGGAWGGTKSFRDIAAGNKPDKVGRTCLAKGCCFCEHLSVSQTLNRLYVSDDEPGSSLTVCQTCPSVVARQMFVQLLMLSVAANIAVSAKLKITIWMNVLHNSLACSATVYANPHTCSESDAVM